MPELAAFQADFALNLARPQPPAAPMRVYRNTVMLGALDALAANFPVVRMIAGESAFEQLALAYARLHPPEVPILALYGQGFPNWVAEQAITRELTYLADVARCERFHTEALHAADAPVLEPSVLEAMSPDQLMRLRLKLHPAARFGWLDTPAMAIWLAHADGPCAEIAPDWRAAGVLFTRPGTRVIGCELDAVGHRLLGGFRLGENLGEAAHAASRLFPDAPIGECFGVLVSRGTFIANPR